MRFKSAFLLFIFIFLLVSCSKIKTRVEVSYNPSTQKGTLLVDDEFPFKLSADSTSVSILLDPGNHKFKLNNGKEFIQNIPQKGGLLNLNDENFVTLIQPYGSGGDENSIFGNNKDISMNEHFVIIDSMIYFYKKDTLQDISDAHIKKVLEINNKSRVQNSFMEYYEKKKFIPKDWDFGLNEDFPETIKERSSSSGSMRIGLTYKSKIIQAPLFKLYAMMTPQYFVVRNLKDIEENKLDKNDDDKKIKEQMKFD